MAMAVEIQFAQRLASNEKRFRDRAVKKLRRYLSARSQRPSGGFNQEELLKIWKGIFYCMWMQDKPLLQEELADTISRLVHTFRNLNAKFLFLETFFQTMNREWNGIDRLRLDKFYTLIRLVLRQFLEELKSTGWDESVVSRFLRCVTDEVLNPTKNGAPSGVRYHFIDIYLQELARVGTQQLTAEQNLKFIDPFCQIAAKTKDRVLFHMISQGIFELIMDQAPFAIEDLMNELQASEEDDASCEELKSSQENEDPAKPEINGSASGEGAGLDGDRKSPNHPQYDEDIGPVLQFDYGAVADRLFQLSSRGSTPTQNRKLLYKLVRKFRDLAEGVFPQETIPHDTSSDEEDEDDFSWKKKKRRQEKGLLKEEEEEVKKKAMKGKNKKKRRSKGRLLAATNESEEPAGVIEKEVADPTVQEPPRKKKKRSRPVDTAVTLESTLLSSDAPTIETSRQEDLVGEDQVSQSKSDTKSLMPIVPKRKKKKKNRKKEEETQLSNGKNSPEDSTPSEPVVSQKAARVLVKLKKQNKRGVVGDEGDAASASQAPVRKKRKVKELSEGPVQRQKLMSSATLQGDARPTAPIKTLNAVEASDFVKFEKVSTPKSIFNRARSSGTTPKPCKEIKAIPTSSAKKVRFGLRKNTTAEFKRTDKSILVSPEGTSRVAFDPKQQPPHSVLKSNSTPTCSPALRPKRASFSAKKRPTAMDFF